MDINVELRKAQAAAPSWELEYRMYLANEVVEEALVFNVFFKKRRELEFLISEDPCATDDEHTRRIRDLEEELGLYGGRNDNG